MAKRAEIGRLGAVLAAAGMWAACNGGGSGTDTETGNIHGTLIDPCSLVTQAEAEAIMSQPVTKTLRDTASGYLTTCFYYGSVDSAHGAILPTRLTITAFTTAGIQAHQGAATVTAQSYIASLKTNLQAGSWETVSGVGTDAIWWKTSGKLSMYKADVEADVIYSPTGKGIDTSAAAKSGAIAGGIKVAAKL